MCLAALPQVPVLDRTLENALKNKVDRKTKPVGSLGRLEALAIQAGLIQHSLAPTVVAPQLVVFAGDHGAARAGVSAYPQEVTWQMVENFLAGGAAINVFARQHHLALTIVDAGVAHDFGARPGLVDAKLAWGTQNYLEEPAMTAQLCLDALHKGGQVVEDLVANSRETVSKTPNVVAFGEMGIGNTASAALLTHALTGASLAACVGRGTGLDDAGLARKQELLAQAWARYTSSGTPVSADPAEAALALLAEFGGLEIAMMAGAMLAAAGQQMMILVDGYIVGAAALVACRLQPALRDYLVFCHRSAEPGHVAQLDALGAAPLLDLGLRLGEGSGAALAFPLLQSACAFLNEMASFESAGVSGQC